MHNWETKKSIILCTWVQRRLNFQINLRWFPFDGTLCCKPIRNSNLCHTLPVKNTRISIHVSSLTLSSFANGFYTNLFNQPIFSTWNSIKKIIILQLIPLEISYSSAFSYMLLNEEYAYFYALLLDDAPGSISYCGIVARSKRIILRVNSGNYGYLASL